MVKKNKKEILVIVAHPDDETIWVGGTLLKSKGNKTIISLCRGNDKDREPKFKKACRVLDAKGYIFDLDDGEEGHYKKISKEEIIKFILNITKNKKYDLLYTHGENGEYEHIRHIEVHKAVKEMLNGELLSVKEVFFFSYQKVENNFQGYAICNSNADKLIKLEKPYLKMKKKIIQGIYGYKKGGFEEKSSADAEAFDIKR